jgi:hypothetical protein
MATAATRLAEIGGWDQSGVRGVPAIASTLRFELRHQVVVVLDDK